MLLKTFSKNAAESEKTETLFYWFENLNLSVFRSSSGTGKLKSDLDLICLDPIQWI